MAKRGDLPAVQWLLDRGADPNGRWSHWDADVVPLHMAAAHGHTDVARWLLQAGADARVRDSKHGGDALSWAEFFGKPEVVELLKTHGGSERGE
jgi:ankyrin repeat protein